jgi:uncharacterized protein with von Willebrand factor type A (vWA) domain
VQRAIGQGGGSDLNKMPLAEMKRLYQRLRGSHHLKKICDRIGRYLRLAAGLQRAKSSHGADEIVGITTSSDLERALPVEIVKLFDEDLGDETIHRWLEGQIFCHELEGIDPQGKGPIVVVVDESGSMYGDLIFNAKAIAAALYHIARSQNRWVCLVGFGDDDESTYLVIEPNKPKPKELLDWLEHFFSGGTNPHVPLVELPGKWKSLGCPAGKTDVVCITDGYLDVDETIEADVNQWKAEENVRWTTLVLSERGEITSNGDSMNAVSDVVHRITNLEVDNQAVQEVLSV